MDLPGALRKHFGYDSFRPLQREIVKDALAGRDAFVLMPTGGWKSLSALPISEGDFASNGKN
jgi:ATP-dependent DNA helicase RecQ